MQETTEIMDQFNRAWITENAIEICERYSWGVLTLRGLHYQLVARGMTNSMKHYKRVVSAMGVARWAGIIPFEQFSDNDRDSIGLTAYRDTPLEAEIEYGKEQVSAWMDSFTRSRWVGQEQVPEVWIEKKALQGVFGPVCRSLGVALTPCKGYASLTLIHEAAERFKGVAEAGAQPIILYFGDYDATGEDIPRSLEDNLNKLGVDIELRRIALHQDQVYEMGLPAAPTKKGDSRGRSWDGHGQVELDAVKPETLQSMCREAVLDCVDDEAYQELLERVEQERGEYRAALKAYVASL